VRATTLPLLYHNYHFSDRLLGLLARFVVRATCVLRDHLDWPDNVAVELIKILGRYPVFVMHMAAHAVDLVAREKRLLYLEPRHESTIARRAVLSVPIAGDLCRIFLVEDGIENWLPGQTRRPCPIATLGNELQFFRPSRTIERDGSIHLISLLLFQRTLFAATEACDCGRMANDADCGRVERRSNQTLSPDSALYMSPLPYTCAGSSWSLYGRVRYDVAPRQDEGQRNDTGHANPHSNNSFSGSARRGICLRRVPRLGYWSGSSWP